MNPFWLTLTPRLRFSQFTTLGWTLPATPSGSPISTWILSRCPLLPTIILRSNYNQIWLVNLTKRPSMNSLRAFWKESCQHGPQAFITMLWKLLRLIARLHSLMIRTILQILMTKSWEKLCRKLRLLPRRRRKRINRGKRRKSPRGRTRKRRSHQRKMIYDLL